MAKSKQEFKVGDLVRVSGHTFSQERRNELWPRHRIKSGTVCTVTGHGVVQTSDGHQQCVVEQQWKLAKQAMRKRDEYAARR